VRVDSEDYEEGKSEAISKVEDFLSDYYQNVYDWYAIEDSRWVNVYPPAVCAGKVGAQVFLDSCYETIKSRQDEIRKKLNLIFNYAPNGITKEMLMTLADPFVSSFARTEYSMLWHHLFKIIKLCSYDDYCIDSYFYNIEDGTNDLPAETADRIAAEPQYWWLVSVDLHY